MTPPSGVSFYMVGTASITVKNSFEVPNISSGFSAAVFNNTTNLTGSGWIQTNSWTSTGLTPNTQYGFKVKLRNAEGLEAQETSITNCYTIANIPLAPALYKPKDTSLQTIVNENGNPSNTVYSIRVSTPGSVLSYVQADGTLGASAIYRTKANWGSSTLVTGLQPSTTYFISCNAMNGDWATTVYSTVSVIMTWGFGPSLAPGWDSTNGYHIHVSINAGNNSADTLYAILNTDSGLWLDGNGDVIATPTYMTIADWEAIPHRNAQTDLLAGTRYKYRIRAKDPSTGETTDSLESSAYTPILAPVFNSVKEINDDYLELNWDTSNGAVGYNIYYSTQSGGILHLIKNISGTTYDDSINGGHLPNQET